MREFATPGVATHRRSVALFALVEKPRVALHEMQTFVQAKALLADHPGWPPDSPNREHEDIANQPGLGVRWRILSWPIFWRAHETSFLQAASSISNIAANGVASPRKARHRYPSSQKRASHRIIFVSAARRPNCRRDRRRSHACRTYKPQVQARGIRRRVPLDRRSPSEGRPTR